MQGHKIEGVFFDLLKSHIKAHPHFSTLIKLLNYNNEGCMNPSLILLN